MNQEKKRARKPEEFDGSNNINIEDVKIIQLKIFFANNLFFFKERFNN